jgi:hypothetical protein
MSIEEINNSCNEIFKKNGEKSPTQVGLRDGANDKTKAAPFHNNMGCGGGLVRNGRHSTFEGVTTHINDFSMVLSRTEEMTPQKLAGLLPPGFKS